MFVIDISGACSLSLAAITDCRFYHHHDFFPESGSIIPSVVKSQGTFQEHKTKILLTDVCIFQRLSDRIFLLHSFHSSALTLETRRHHLLATDTISVASFSKV